MICADLEVIGYADQAYFNVPTDTHGSTGYNAPPQHQPAQYNTPSYGSNVPTYGNTNAAPPSYGNANSAVPSYGGVPSYGNQPSVPTYGAPQNTPSYGISAPSHGNPQIAPSYGAPYGSGGGGYGNRAVVRDDSNMNITPIKEINPYSNKWTIKARVTKKTDIKTWNNAKGSGTLFSIDLLDNEGTEIRATFFKEACDKFFPIVAEQGVYTFSAGKLKIVANQQFSNIKNPYELSFDMHSEIRPAAEDGGIRSAAAFHFVRIADISTMETNKLVGE